MKYSRPRIRLITPLSEKIIVLARLLTRLNRWKIKPIATASNVIEINAWTVIATNGE